MKSHIPAILDRASVDLVSHSPAQTIRIGQQIGSLLQAGDIVLLFGTFGVGKTHLTKGLAKAFGVAEADVTSPTFVLVNNYRGDKQHGRVQLNHVDLYRLDAKQLDSIGLDELWNDDTICIIEWAERINDDIPTECLIIHMDHLSESKRLMRITPHGERYQPIIEGLVNGN